MTRENSVGAGVKARAVLALLAGEGATAVCRRYGVGKTTLAFWKMRALEGLRGALMNGKGRPRKERSSPERERKVKTLASRVASRDLLIGKLKEQLARRKSDEPRPRACPLCGCEKTYRHGMRTIGHHRIGDLAQALGSSVMPRFRCASCRNFIEPDTGTIIYYLFMSRR